MSSILRIFQSLLVFPSRPKHFDEFDMTRIKENVPLRLSEMGTFRWEKFFQIFHKLLSDRSFEDGLRT
jgi:hypothetical protein